MLWCWPASVRAVSSQPALQVTLSLMKCQRWPSLPVRSCAETDVDIRFPFFSRVIVLQAQTAGGDVELCLHSFCLRSFVRRLVTETNRRWISSAGGKWHWELENKVKYLSLIGPQEEGGVRLISPPACLTQSGSSVCQRSPLVGWQRETLCRMMNKFYNPLYFSEMWTFLKAARTWSCPQEPLSPPQLLLSPHFYNLSKGRSSFWIGEAHNTPLNKIILPAPLRCRCRWVGSSTSRLSFQFEHQRVQGEATGSLSSQNWSLILCHTSLEAKQPYCVQWQNIMVPKMQLQEK